MRNVSIITLVTLFFALTMVVINIALGLEYKRQRTDGDYFAFQRFIMSVKMMHNAPFEEMPKEWSSLHVNVSTMDKNTVAQEGKKVLEDPFFDMMRYENKLYFVPKTMPFPPPFPRLTPLKMSTLKRYGHRSRLCLFWKIPLKFRWCVCGFWRV